VVAVTEGGTRVLLRRETVDDLLASTSVTRKEAFATLPRHAGLSH
jgi:hypothetical protein